MAKLHIFEEREVDAEFTVGKPTAPGADFDVVLRSRSGKQQDGRERNPEYFLALEELLVRLAALDCRIVDAVVDSTKARDLPREQRRIVALPLSLATERDIRSLRRAMCTAQRPVAQQPGAKGGNNHKRIRISVAGLSGRTAAEVEAVLVSPRHR